MPPSWKNVSTAALLETDWFLALLTTPVSCHPSPRLHHMLDRLGLKARAPAQWTNGREIYYDVIAFERRLERLCSKTISGSNLILVFALLIIACGALIDEKLPGLTTSFVEFAATSNDRLNDSITQSRLRPRYTRGNIDGRHIWRTVVSGLQCTSQSFLAAVVRSDRPSKSSDSRHKIAIKIRIFRNVRINDEQWIHSWFHSTFFDLRLTATLAADNVRFRGYKGQHVGSTFAGSIDRPSCRIVLARVSRPLLVVLKFNG